MIKEISARELRSRLDTADRPLVLDVREAEELAIARLPDAKHIPMNDVPARLAELDPAAEIVVVCHHGMRSAHVARFLAERGFTRVVNLAGGIDAWAAEVDPAVPRY
ncbi:MAG TPA: rhodanese-like domain-containing protein [Candidatus Bathyarchaeia archaeon]|nr:rhodanese-like domain-containing protein [Candidatus Bathyarchaeia archaeon]